MAEWEELAEEVSQIMLSNGARFAIRTPCISLPLGSRCIHPHRDDGFGQSCPETRNAADKTTGSAVSPQGCPEVFSDFKKFRLTAR